MTMHATGGGYGPPGAGGPGGYGPPGGGSPGGWGPPGGGPPGGGPPGGGGYGGPPGGGGYGGPPGGGGFGGPPGGGGPSDPGGMMPAYGAPPNFSGAVTGYGGPPPPPQKSNTGLIIGAIAGVVALLGIVGAVGAYFALSGGSSSSAVTISDGKGGSIAIPAKASSKAYMHVPSGCEVLVRVDMARTVAHPSFKQHLVPALDDLEKGATTDPNSQKFQEFLRLAGIDAKNDVKDLALCFTGLDGPKSSIKMAFILGGELRPEAVVPALQKTDDVIVSTTADGRKLATTSGKSGDTYTIAQASDGAIIISNDPLYFDSASRASSLYQSEYTLPVDTEAAMVVSGALIARASDGGRNNPFAKDLKGITRIAGTLALTDPRAEVRITLGTPAEATRLTASINQLLPRLKQEIGKERSQAGEVEAFKAAKVKATGNEVIVEMPWTAEGVDQAAQKLAEAIRDAKKKGNFNDITGTF